MPDPDEEHRQDLIRLAHKAFQKSSHLKPAVRERYIYGVVYLAAYRYFTDIEKHGTASAHFVAKHRAQAAINQACH